MSIYRKGGGKQDLNCLKFKILVSFYISARSKPSYIDYGGHNDIVATLKYQCVYNDIAAALKSKCV